MKVQRWHIEKFATFPAKAGLDRQTARESGWIMCVRPKCEALNREAKEDGLTCGFFDFVNQVFLGSLKKSLEGGPKGIQITVDEKVIL